MDPQAAWGRWLYALQTGDREEAKEAYADLKNWIRNGGFEPKWTAAERKRFMAWR